MSGRLEKLPSLVLNETQTLGLSHLSQLILEENKNLLPHIYAIGSENVERAMRLWYTKFSRGVFLSTGGAQEAFLKMEDIKAKVGHRPFNLYRADCTDVTILKQPEMIKFLQEEKAIAHSTPIDQLHVSFCYGNHEGTTRLGRCLYKKNINDGILYPKGSYGLIATAFGTMKPTPYKVRLIEVDRAKGDKILIESLQASSKKYPTAKTLFVELKTLAGAVYTPDEINQIIDVCQRNNLFLVADAAHINMDFDESHRLPDVAGLCQKKEFYNFAVVFTGSKTYGLERIRSGFFITHKSSTSYPLLSSMVDREFTRPLGSLMDLPFDVTKALIDSPVSEREAFRRKCAMKHHRNMNLMLAYIEGVDSKNIDTHHRDWVRDQIPNEYHAGIRGMKVVYKPEGGLQMKVDVSALQNTYFTNIRMFNSEIFTYTLHHIMGVVSLHSYQILDDSGFAMRLSFAVRKDVHQGLQLIHQFINLLSKEPRFNPFLPGVKSTDQIIFPMEAEIKSNLKKSREAALFLKANSKLLLETYRSNIKKFPTFFYRNHIRTNPDHVIYQAAKTIQHLWRSHAALHKDESPQAKELRLYGLNKDRFAYEADKESMTMPSARL